MFELYRQCIEPDIRNEWKDASEGFFKQQIENGVEWMEYLGKYRRLNSTLGELTEKAMFVLKCQEAFVKNYLPEHPEDGFMVEVDDEGVTCKPCKMHWGDTPEPFVKVVAYGSKGSATKKEKNFWKMTEEERDQVAAEILTDFPLSELGNVSAYGLAMMCRKKYRKKAEREKAKARWSNMADLYFRMNNDFIALIRETPSGCKVPDLSELASGSKYLGFWSEADCFWQD